MNKILVVLLLITISVVGQKKINNYKYVIIPEQFEFAKKPDQYKANSMLKFLFQKKGYTVFLTNETLPADLVENKCSSLLASVKDKSGMFVTKVIIELKDCFNNVVYTSTEGKSRIKDYKRAYQEAIRQAFKPIKGMSYNYIPSKTENNKVKQQKITKNKEIEISNILYAQPKNNGYQLVNSKPEIVFEILNTTLQDVFIIKNLQGILYKKDNHWFVEYYKENSKTTKEINIKF